MPNSCLITVQASKLAAQTQLLLTFNKPSNSSLLQDQYQVAWRVFILQPHGDAQSKAEWTDQPAFSSPQITTGNIISSQSSQPIDAGQECQIVMDGGYPNVTVPTSNANLGDIMKCTNRTGDFTDIAVGFMAGDTFEPALTWLNVGDTQAATADVTPILSIYETSQYQKSQLIKGDIEGGLLWTGNLIELSPKVTLHYSVDDTGKPQITAS